jgi:hypothetical protein
MLSTRRAGGKWRVVMIDATIPEMPGTRMNAGRLLLGKSIERECAPMNPDKIEQSAR